MSRLDRLEKKAIERKRLLESVRDEWWPKTDEEHDAYLMALHWLGWGVQEQPKLWCHLPDDIREAYERNDQGAIRATQASGLEWFDGYPMPDGGRIVPLYVEETDMVHLHRFPCVCDPEVIRLPPLGDTEESAV